MRRKSKKTKIFLAKHLVVYLFTTFVITYLLFFLVVNPLYAMGPSTADKKVEHIIWPPPPWQPRIQFLYSVNTPDDLDIKKGLFRKIWEFVMGGSREGVVKPFGIYADDIGRLYVTDTAEQVVHVFDTRDNNYFIIQGLDKKSHLTSPIGVVTDSAGKIFISDSVMRRVYVFDEKGKFINEIGSDNMMQRPTGLAIDKAQGLLYVVDTIACKIHVYSIDGRYIKSIGEYGKGNGQFNRPTFIAIGKDGNLYITDTMNVRVQIIDKNGKFIGKFGKRGDGTGDFANPRGIAIDSDDNIYVTDTILDAVQIFDKSGRLLLVFGRSGTKNGEFSIPAGISISKDDKIYVADSYNMRIQVFRYLKSSQSTDQNSQGTR